MIDLGPMEVTRQDRVHCLKVGSVEHNETCRNCIFYRACTQKMRHEMREQNRGREMSRVEENKRVTNEILGESGKQANFNESLIMNANMIVSLLIDISKSLAAISDDLSLKRDIEEQTRVYEQMEKREP